MSQSSSFQRFLGELRRRHVPQTVAVYAVAAWAAIEFADVVIPNLDGPQWVITAVIVAAGVGLPIVVVLAWVFDWGPDGLHRTSGESSEARSSSAPWMAAVGVLAVVVGGGIAVAALIEEGGEGAGVVEEAPDQHRSNSVVPSGSVANPDSIRNRVMQDIAQFEGLRDLGRLESLGALGDADSMDLEALVGLAVEAAGAAGVAVFVQEPGEWRVGRSTPVVLPEGDTLAVRGLAQDTSGVRSVSLDGSTIAEGDGSQTLRFSGSIVGEAPAGERGVEIRVETVDGREIVREYRIRQAPSTPSVRR